MKTRSILILFLIILGLGACKKDSPNIWTFKSKSYNQAYAQYNQAGSTGSDSVLAGRYYMVMSDATLSSASTSYMTVIFPNNSGNPSPGVYSVVKGEGYPGTNQVIIRFGVGYYSQRTNYSSTGGNGNEIVNVSIVSGKVTATASSVTVLNKTDASDSSTLSFHVTETSR